MRRSVIILDFAIKSSFFRLLGAFRFEEKLRLGVSRGVDGMGLSLVRQLFKQARFERVDRAGAGVAGGDVHINFWRIGVC